MLLRLTGQGGRGKRPKHSGRLYGPICADKGGEKKKNNNALKATLRRKKGRKRKSHRSEKFELDVLAHLARGTTGKKEREGGGKQEG